jgi:tetratricopeptide (TPR) repeat protein
MELALLYHQNGRKKEANAIFKSLGSRSLEDFDIILQIIQLYLEKDRNDEAIIVVNGLLAGAPDSSELHHLSGIAFYSMKDKNKAMAQFSRVAAGTRFYKDAVVHIAFIYQEEKNTDKAIEYLKSVLEKSPDNSEFMYYLGTFYEETNEYEKAEQVLKKAIAIDSDKAKLYFRLGVVYDKWGRKETSIEQMRTVIELDPKHANALNYLGYTYADQGKNLDEAERLVKEALKYKPDDGYITDSLGWVYYKKGEYKKALGVLQRAVELVPDDPIILEHLGDAYRKNDDPRNALKYYKRSLKVKDKDRDELRQKISELEAQ